MGHQPPASLPEATLHFDEVSKSPAVTGAGGTLPRPGPELELPLLNSRREEGAPAISAITQGSTGSPPCSVATRGHRVMHCVIDRFSLVPIRCNLQEGHSYWAFDSSLGISKPRRHLPWVCFAGRTRSGPPRVPPGPKSLHSDLCYGVGAQVYTCVKTHRTGHHRSRFYCV